MTTLMHGFPPSPEAQVTLGNWRQPPWLRWAFQHVREIVPSADIPNARGAVHKLPKAPRVLSDLTVPNGGTAMPFAEFLAHTRTDGLVVLHKGNLVFEHYANGMTPETPHILMSVSKSVLGLIAGIVAGQGALDPESLVTAYVPEVADTAFAGATVRDLLDMRSGVAFNEDYLATEGPIVEYRKATNWGPLAPGQEPSDLRSFFGMLTKADQSHGRPWHYISPNTDLLGWVIERAARQRYADLASELLWQPMGAGRHAYITVDRLGAPRAAGGWCCTTRDLARLGLLFANGGSGVVPGAWIDDILTGGDKAAWEASAGRDKYPGLPVRYRSQWYVLDRPSPIAFAIGVYGQSLFVDPGNGVVMAKFSSQDLPVDPERKMLTIRAAEAVRDHLTG
jgi:CubicO group peptidase (beta-lactamase class C family)